MKIVFKEHNIEAHYEEGRHTRIPYQLSPPTATSFTNYGQSTIISLEIPGQLHNVMDAALIYPAASWGFDERKYYYLHGKSVSKQFWKRNRATVLGIIYNAEMV